MPATENKPRTLGVNDGVNVWENMKKCFVMCIVHYLL